MPALARGAVVLCDRFVDATYAYQGYGRGVDLGIIATLNRLVTKGVTPNLTVLLDCDVETGLKRKLVDSPQPDRFEQEEAAFHEQIRRGYLKLAEEDEKRFFVVNGKQDIGATHRAIRGKGGEAAGEPWSLAPSVIDRQKQVLSSLVEKGRLPHALLFAGPRGVGKRTIAVELVRNLFCKKGSGCGACRGCRGLDSGIHPDFTLVTGEASIKIDELRAIMKEVYEPPFEAQVRAVLIDNADLMTREAANALLKTLEEPPPSNLFLLVSVEGAGDTADREVPLHASRVRPAFHGRPVRRTSSGSLRLEGQEARALAAMSNGSIASGLFWMEEEHYRMRQRIAELLTGGNGRPPRRPSCGKDGGEGARDGIPLLPPLLFQGHLVALPRRRRRAPGLLNEDLAGIMSGVAAGGAAWAEASIKKIQEMLRTLRYNINRWLAMETLLLQPREAGMKSCRVKFDICDRDGRAGGARRP